MLVIKNPYVVEARQNLSPKNPHVALKTGEKFPQNLRLKSLIFIVEKYRKKCLCIKINTCFTLCGIYPYFWGGMFDRTYNLCIPNMSVLLQNL